MDGEIPTEWEGITFATVQSAISRLGERPNFCVVLIDEAHHVGSDSFRRVANRLGEAMIGAVTATPSR